MERAGAEQGGNEVSISVNYPPLGDLPVNRSNLRVDGLFVDTGAVTLPHHCEVQVTLAIRRPNGFQFHRLHARVMGRSRYGTNLTFQDCRRDTYHALREVVAQRQS
jgi:hypothetical protein